MRPIVIFGAGELAETAAFYFAHDSDLAVAAFTVDRQFIREDTFAGLPVIPFDEVARLFPPSSHGFFVAVSYSNLNKLRAAKCAEAKQKGYGLASYVSSKATIWPGFVAGENCFILEDNTIQPFARIGSNVTMWSGNHIGHHAHIADNCFITSHVVISGGVKVGEYTFIGVNATIRDHVTIGANCVIGAGALIVQDAADSSVYSGPVAELSRVPSHRLRRI